MESRFHYLNLSGLENSHFKRKAGDLFARVRWSGPGYLGEDPSRFIHISI